MHQHTGYNSPLLELQLDDGKIYILNVLVMYP